MSNPSVPPTGERADILEALAAHRWFLRHTVQGLTDDQARQRTTASELTLGGLIKHVAATESGWADFIVRRPGRWRSPEGEFDPNPELAAGVAERVQDAARRDPGRRPGRYERVAARTDALVESLPDLDLSHPLPPAPWFPPGATRSARRVFLHIVAETAQHSGHADIIRETIDGQKTMG